MICCLKHTEYHIPQVPDARTPAVQTRSLDHLAHKIMTEQPAHRAAKDGDVGALRRELENGVSPNILSPGRWRPLHHLCSRGDNPEARVDCLHVLLEAGADIHAPDDPQRTPLHYAASQSNEEVVAALLEAGADMNRGDIHGETPLHRACVRSDSVVEPALVLIRNGAAVDVRDDDGHTPLDWAIIYSRRRLVPILLRAGATPPAQTTNAYIQKVIAAGGFETYKRIHLDALAATFTPKLAHRLPKELVRIVVEYAFHVGDY